MAVDGSEQRPVRYAGPGLPLFESAHGTPTASGKRNTDLATLAGLIGFGTAERENDALTHALSRRSEPLNSDLRAAREPDQ